MVFWIAAAPLFLLANLVVGLGWKDPHYSWTTNNISDLGNVHCGVWDTTRPRYVCSPWHDMMNVAFVLTALLLLTGFVLTWRTWGKGRLARSMMVLWAAGLGLAGAFPADTHENMHFLAAVLIFGPGNLGLLITGLTRRDSSLAWGLLAVAGSALFIAQQDLGLGMGTMERVAAFPLLIWTCYLGTREIIRRR